MAASFHYWGEEKGYIVIKINILDILNALQQRMDYLFHLQNVLRYKFRHIKDLPYHIPRPIDIEVLVRLASLLLHLVNHSFGHAVKQPRDGLPDGLFKGHDEVSHKFKVGGCGHLLGVSDDCLYEVLGERRYLFFDFLLFQQVLHCFLGEIGKGRFFVLFDKACYDKVERGLEQFVSFFKDFRHVVA